MDRRPIINLFIKLAWIGLSLSIGIPHFLSGQYSGEYALGFVILMSLITFPIGYLVSFGMNLFCWAAFHLFEFELPASLMSSIILWFLYTVAGYFQWFYLIPKIYFRLKAMICT